MNQTEWPIPKRRRNNYIRTSGHFDASLVQAAKEIAAEETERLSRRGVRGGNQVSWSTILIGVALGIGPDIQQHRARLKRRKNQLDKERNNERNQGGVSSD